MRQGNQIDTLNINSDLRSLILYEQDILQKLQDVSRILKIRDNSPSTKILWDIFFTAFEFSMLIILRNEASN